MSVGWAASSWLTSTAILVSSLGTAQRSPVGRRATSSWALATSIPTKSELLDICNSWLARPCRIRARWHQTTVRALGVTDVTTQALPRSPPTCGVSVYHVRDPGDGGFPPLPIKIQGDYRSPAMPEAVASDAPQPQSDDAQ